MVIEGVGVAMAKGGKVSGKITQAKRFLRHP